MCRLQGCRSPARIDPENPELSSKYCSDEHAQDFFDRKFKGIDATARMDIGARAKDEKRATQKIGTSQISRERLNRLLREIGTVDQFQTLGDLGTTAKIKEALGKIYEVDLGRGEEPIKISDIEPILTHVPDVIRRHLRRLIKKHSDLEDGMPLFNDRRIFLKRAVLRQKTLLALLQTREPKLKGICGYDNRLSWSDAEFVFFRNTSEGKSVLAKDGTLGACSYDDSSDDNNNEWDAKLERIDNEEQRNTIKKEIRGVCTRKPNNCNQHRSWETTYAVSISTEESRARDEMKHIEANVLAMLKQLVVNHQDTEAVLKLSEDLKDHHPDTLVGLN